MEDYQKLCLIIDAAEASPQLNGAAIQFGEQLLGRTPEAAHGFRGMLLAILAQCYQNLPTTDRATALRRAIEYYLRALQYRTPQTDPLRYARTRLNLGNAYTEIQGPDRIAALQEGTSSYQEALRFFSPENNPAEYANTQNSLGCAYAELPTGDRAAHIAAAIDCFGAALKIYHTERDRIDRAQTLTNLGHAYRRSPADRPQNIARAISCYEQALAIYTDADNTSGQAQALLGLGNAYDELPTGDRAANRERSISYHQKALELLPPGGTYGMVENNLGNSYRHRILGDPATNVEASIGAYRKALEVFTFDNDPHEWATVHNGLGLAFLDRRMGDHEQNVTQAIDHFEKSLRYRRPETEPLLYADSMGNLGRAYLGRDANRAVQCYQQALHSLPGDTVPLNYARTQVNLGNAYRLRSGRIDDEDMQAATRCFEEALRIFTLHDDPGGHRAAATNLGDMLMGAHFWERAHTALNEAVRATDLEYHTGATPVSRQAELGEIKPLFVMDAYCLARMGRLQEAVERLEAGRTRALSEALFLDRIVLQTLAENDRAEFVATRDALQAAQANARSASTGAAAGVSPTFAEVSAQVAAARRQLRESDRANPNISAGLHA